MVNSEDLKQAVLKAIPFRVDPILGYEDRSITIHGVKEYFNPRREDIILEASDNEIKAAISKLLKEGLIECRGRTGKCSLYSRVGEDQRFAEVLPSC